MQADPDVSVIVTVYNAGEYLSECLNSISGQDFQNMEIIIVDDGSSDISVKICDEFRRFDSRSKLIRKVNGGVSSARNVGLQVAKGEFILFVDSDDLLMSNAVSSLYKLGHSNKSDIVVGDYVVRNLSGIDSLVPVKAFGTQLEFLNSLILGENHSALWNKLIRKKSIACFQFINGLDYMEDKLILVEMLVKLKIVISYLDKPVYIYRQHQGSITNRISYMMAANSARAVNEILKLVNDTVDVNIITQFIINNNITLIAKGKPEFVHELRLACILNSSSSKTSHKFMLVMWKVNKKMSVMIYAVLAKIRNFEFRGLK
jgi:glycosyltransferase involved in cell wall biosynthesis